jgi:hypothetical protein
MDIIVVFNPASVALAANYKHISTINNVTEVGLQDKLSTSFYRFTIKKQRRIH